MLNSSIELFNTVYSWSFVRHLAPTFSKVGKIDYLFEVQIITGFDNISGIQFTSEKKD